MISNNNNSCDSYYDNNDNNKKNIIFSTKMMSCIQCNRNSNNRHCKSSQTTSSSLSKVVSSSSSKVVSSLNTKSTSFRSSSLSVLKPASLKKYLIYSLILSVLYCYSCNAENVIDKKHNYDVVNFDIVYDDNNNDNNNDEVRIVGTADGYIHAVDANNNKIWSTNTGGPLSSQHNSGNLDYSVLPSVDGSIFVHSTEGMRKTSVKARMLAEKTPIMTQDGLLLTSQKTSRVFSVDMMNGRVIHDSDSNTNNNNIVSTNNEMTRKIRTKAIGSGAVKKPLWLGRTDYTLRAFDEISGLEEFNITFSELRPLSHASANDKESTQLTETNKDPNNNDEKQKKLHGALVSTTPLPLVATPDGDVFFADKSGNSHRGLSLGSPVVNAFSVKDGDKVVRTSEFDIRPLRISYRMQSSVGDDKEGDDSFVVVRSLNDGSLYALELPVTESSQSLLPNDEGVLALPDPNDPEDIELSVKISDGIYKLKKPDGVVNKYRPGHYLEMIKENESVIENDPKPTRLYLFEALLLRWILTVIVILMSAYLARKLSLPLPSVVAFYIDSFFDGSLVFGPTLKKINYDVIKDISPVENITEATATVIEAQEEYDDQGRKILRIGSLSLQPSVILGYGSHGTVVFRGSLNGRPLAIKRMLSQFSKAAEREIGLLIRSDGHANVVRYFLKEQQGEFVYLALQLCRMSLRDFVMQLQKSLQAKRAKEQANQTKSNNSFAVLHSSAASKYTIDAVSEIPDVARKALLQIAEGLAHLHSQRIVHRDIKPHNILCAHPEGSPLLDEDDYTAANPVESLDDIGNFVLKISDMGLSKQLADADGSFSMSMSMPAQNGELSSLASSASSRSDHKAVEQGPVGTIGWQAPELMAFRGTGLTMPEIEEDKEVDDVDSGTNENSNTDNNEESGLDNLDISATNLTPKEQKIQDRRLKSRRTQNVDIFSLGCVFHYVLVPGIHPFGLWYEREANIMNNKLNISALSQFPDAIDLISRMLKQNPDDRPMASQVCNHPFFWLSQKRLDFLVELSDRLEHEKIDAPIVLSMEANASQIVTRSWDKKLHNVLKEDMGKYRKYDNSSVRDLLRLIRNKRHHYNEFDEEAKSIVGPMPSGFMNYFESRFPTLLLHCIKVACRFLKEDKDFIPYCRAIAPLFVEEYAIPAQEPSTLTSTEKTGASETAIPQQVAVNNIQDDVIVWSGSVLEESYQCRGWWRHQVSWIEGKTGKPFKPRPSHLTRASTEVRYRSRLCTHWEMTGGTNCPMRRKGKCDFAHGPLELRVKESRRDKWGSIPYNSSMANSPEFLRCSGGEDCLTSARSIDKVRVEVGNVGTTEKSIALAINTKQNASTNNSIKSNSNKVDINSLISNKTITTITNNASKTNGNDDKNHLNNNKTNNDEVINNNNNWNI